MASPGKLKMKLVLAPYVAEIIETLESEGAQRFEERISVRAADGELDPATGTGGQVDLVEPSEALTALVAALRADDIHIELVE